MRAQIGNVSGLRGSWIVANAIGLSLGMALFAAVADGVEQLGMFASPDVADVVGHLIGLPLAGMVFGLAQWYILRKVFAGLGWGILGSAVGLTLGYLFGWALGGPPIDHVVAPAAGALLGSCAHWLALRRQTTGAAWWVGMSTLGFLLGGIAGVAIAVLGLGDAIGGGYLGWIALNAIMYVVGGAIGGAVSSIWLMRHAAQTRPLHEVGELRGVGAR